MSRSLARICEGRSLVPCNSEFWGLVRLNKIVLIFLRAKNLLDARLEQQRVRDFSAQLKAAIEMGEKLAAEAGSQAPKLKAERADLEQQVDRLADAICPHGYSSSLSAELT